MSPAQNPNNERRLIDWIIAALGVTLAILLFFFVRQYRILRRESILNIRESGLTNTFKNNPHLTPNDADVIQFWMTFNYLNKLFNLPPEYLKTQLSISDAAYPELTVSKYARDSHQFASSTLEEVQSAVRQYIFLHSTPQNTSST